MRAWGVDGYRRGWIAVWIDPDGGRGFELFPDATPLAALSAALVMIDIPIGLPESDYRGCDLAARKLLGKARSRVFLGLRRPLLRHLGDYAAANAWAKTDGKGLAKQSFAILPKIAEIDAIVLPERQRRLREAHPELVFARWNGGTALPSKHTPEGLAARRGHLGRRGFDDLDLWLEKLQRSGAKPDDLYDACALAAAASEAMQGHARRVKCPETRDARGLRMDIWF